MHSQGTYKQAECKRKLNLLLSQGGVQDCEMLNMMMINENHTVPVTGPCDTIQGAEEPLLRTQNLWVNHDHQQGRGWFSLNTNQVKRRGPGYGRSTQYSRQEQLVSSLMYCKLYSYFVTGEDE